MIKRLAYRIVFNDIVKKRGLFDGHYDAVHGTDTFMHGVALVMEFIAYNVSEKVGDEFQINFTDNMIASEEKAKKWK